MKKINIKINCHSLFSIITNMQAGREVVWKIERSVVNFGGNEFNKHGHGVVALLAFILGTGFGAGIFLFLLSENWVDFGAYIFCLSFFHWSEYIMVAMHRKQVLTAHC